jgi:hypothetical protein
MKVGQRIRICKSDEGQLQHFPVGERGTLVRFEINNDKHIIMKIKFDNGETYIMDSTHFRFEVYR